MKLAAFCDQDTATGLQLSGIKMTFIPKNNTIETWNEITQQKDIGILLITEKIAEELKKELKEFRILNSLPIIVEIPDKHGRKSDHVDYVSQLIKKAVGIEVKK
jgi:V/A-type H+-transporting ATPase subunit F